MDCFSSVVWSLGHTGWAEAVTFNIVSSTCKQKGRHYHPLSVIVLIIRELQQVCVTPAVLP